MIADSLDIVLDLAKAIGAEEAPSAQQLVLYIPDKDKNGKRIKYIKRWIREAKKVFNEIGGGATTFPPAEGTWLNPETNRTLWEKTTIIYTYIYSEKFEKNILLLRKFLHKFGREANQGEVVFEFDGKFYRIQKYDMK
ncbi:MAG: hypothetical protein A2161_19950 [Candidatus Schekmanbacteria bacterium RBG_13_48_7]|uniref:Uncharacterized protein n=1 Tax=Candidatus Schekmanbacteria bacterium RBG_13_48_7 TaxID=1817878 RepID=A0A1F7S1Z9_9BACT|nr:MAG: hypothetical protein A2161_19950 [Candidatus Schekmanbacteria bacterium RBG_13_48_7]